MDKAGFLKKLRLYLADPDGKIWDDIELYRILDDALKQYCYDSGAFVGSFDFCPDSAGVYHYPDDFSAFMIGWNSKGEEITPASARELFYRSGRDAYRFGDAEYIYDDLVSQGEFALYPTPPDMQNRKTISISSNYGEIMNSEFGVFVADEYGTTLSVDNFDFAGTVFYRKNGNFEDVKDYMAVICFALNLAYCADSDFANSETAAFWKNMYKSRLAVFGRVLHNNSGKVVSGQFY